MKMNVSHILLVVNTKRLKEKFAFNGKGEQGWRTQPINLADLYILRTDIEYWNYLLLDFLWLGLNVVYLLYAWNVSSCIQAHLLLPRTIVPTLILWKFYA